MVQEMGWAGYGNGELLRIAADGGFEALVTVDKGSHTRSAAINSKQAMNSRKPPTSSELPAGHGPELVEPVQLAQRIVTAASVDSGIERPPRDDLNDLREPGSPRDMCRLGGRFQGVFKDGCNGRCSGDERFNSPTPRKPLQFIQRHEQCEIDRVRNATHLVRSIFYSIRQDRRHASLPYR